MKNFAFALAALSLSLPAVAQDDFRAFGIGLGQPLSEVAGVINPDDKDILVFQVEPSVPNGILENYFIHTTEDELVCRITADIYLEPHRALDAGEVLHEELKRKYPSIDPLAFYLRNGNEGRAKDQAYLDGGGFLLAMATDDLPSPLSAIKLVVGKASKDHRVALVYESDQYVCADDLIVQDPAPTQPTEASGL